MKLAQLSPQMLAKAVEIYVGLAYPKDPPQNPIPDFSKLENFQQVLTSFQDECGRDMEKKLHRYTLRLGNARYPFMKLVLQEVLIEGEYFLTVDTHDEMDIKPTFPDYNAWKDLKKYNAKLKGEIEKGWEKASLPTYATLQGLACELIPDDIGRSGKQRILVVDDEKNIRETIAALLAARGYLIETAADGEEALEKVGWLKPDLIFLDYEMPGLDGLATIEKLKSREDTKLIPVLLATAGQISLDQVQMANGFLVKPFQRKVMFSFVDHLLGNKTT